jgi:hypothetical protein
MSQRLIDLCSRGRTPALHSMLHRYGIPQGTSLDQQERARSELWSILCEAYNMGRRSFEADVSNGSEVPHVAAGEISEPSGQVSGGAGVERSSGPPCRSGERGPVR